MAEFWKQIFVVGHGIFTGLATVLIDVLTVAQGPEARWCKRMREKNKSWGRKERKLQLCLSQLKKNSLSGPLLSHKEQRSSRQQGLMRFHDPFSVSSQFLSFQSKPPNGSTKNKTEQNLNTWQLTNIPKTQLEFRILRKNLPTAAISSYFCQETQERICLSASGAVVWKTKPS